MVTTKRVKTSGGKPGRVGSMSISAIVVALIGTVLLLIAFLSRPQISFLKGIPVITQGLIAPALILGVVLWSVVEFFTPPGKNIWDLLERIIPAFLVGAFVGGYLGYALHFGAYVLRPAFSGNTLAMFFLASTLIAALAVMWDAAWAHTHGFRGQHSKGTHSLSRRESGTSKGARGTLALLIIFVVFLLIVPVGADLGSVAASGHMKQSNSIGQEFLVSNNQVLSVRNENSSAPVSNLFRGSAPPFGMYIEEYSMPTHDVKNATGVEVPEYYHTAYVTTYLTVGELNQYAVNQFQLYFPIKITANITIGTGVNIGGISVPGASSSTRGVAIASPSTSSSLNFNGTNASTFHPIETVHVNDSYYANLTIQPYMLLGNQTNSITYEIQTNSTTHIEVVASERGNSGGITVFWPYSIIQVSYVIGGIILLGASLFGLTMIDMDMGKVSKSISKVKDQAKKTRKSKVKKK